MDLTGIKYLIVGAGITGLTIAERLEVEHHNVVVIDKAKQIGGLCFDYIDKDTGIRCHKYGTHVFHTNSRIVYDYISKFCTLNHYRHKIMIRWNKKCYPWPINLQTINMFFGIDSTPRHAENVLNIIGTTFANISVDHIEPAINTAAYRKSLPKQPPPTNMRDALISRMGVKMYEAFVENYSFKQWGVDPSQLPASVATRIPVKTDYNTDFFGDRWQGVHENGYEGLFASMTKNIPVHLGINYFDIKSQIPKECVIIWTGPLDLWFEYKFGQLPWRGVKQEFSIHNLRDYQGAAIINYPETHIPHTRIHEFKHLHPENIHCSRRKTVIAHEYPNQNAEMSYPVQPDGVIAEAYREAATYEKNVVFCGRLATYRYLNMDQAVLEALSCAEKICKQSP